MDWTPDNWKAEQAKLSKTMSIDVYRTDAIVVRSYESSRKVVPPSDSSIKGIPSKRSLQNLVFLLNNCDVPMTNMLTVTLAKDVSDAMSIDDHKGLLRASLQRLRRSKATQYCWVREHQQNGTPHWHIFVDGPSDPGIDLETSVSWSNWVAEYCHKRVRQFGLLDKLAYMSDGNGIDFIGCCRMERLRDDAAGRYAGKEGAKRFQKMAPPRWHRCGGWWRASRNITCTPIERRQVSVSSLHSTTITTDSGEVLEVPFRNQFGRGLLCDGQKDKT